MIEDAHWIDPTTLELIELALDRVQGARVLTLITARPTFLASFGSHPVVTRLALNRLGRAATEAIITRIARGKRLPEVLLDEIGAKTDGVPLFVEEMTKAVIESGVLREDGDAYHLEGPLSALAIPTTLHDSLMARLDRLQPVKEVAQTAAVIGRSFDHRTIAALSDKPADELASALRQLVEAELIFRRGTPPEATYLFKHALVRDAAYESLLKARRISLHTRLLDVLEHRGDAAAELKAQHAEAAGLIERALDYWEQAGTQALARPAYKEAIANLENAVRLCHTMGEAPQWKGRELGLWLQLGQALIASQGYQSAATLRAFEHARVLADEIGDESLQLAAVYGQWVYLYLRGRGSGELAKRYGALANAQVESGVRLVGLRMLGLERFHEGRFRESLVLFRKSLDLYDPVAHRDLATRFGHDPRTAAANYQSWISGTWASRSGCSNERRQSAMDPAGQPRQHHRDRTVLRDQLLNIWLRRPDRVESAAREALLLAKKTRWHFGMPLLRSIWVGLFHNWARRLALTRSRPAQREIRELGAVGSDRLHLGIAAELTRAPAGTARPRPASRGVCCLGTWP